MAADTAAGMALVLVVLVWRNDIYTDQESACSGKRQQRHRCRFTGIRAICAQLVALAHLRTRIILVPAGILITSLATADK